MATVAQLNAVVTADVGNFTRGMDTAAGRLGNLNDRTRSQTENMARMGQSLTRNVTVPLAAAGVASVKLASDFETSFAQIEGLVGVAGDELNDLRDFTLALGPAVGKGPNELAEAMFFITSAGLRTTDAMEALEASAKASAAGLGDVATVADAATSAMNAYGPEVLSAVAATDVLVATVREGKLAPEELASAMGKVLPTASSLGVSFDEVGASLAVMSRTGLNAAESSTALNAILNTMLRPTTQAEEALAGLGTSAAELRTMIDDEGLLATLQFLEDAFDGDTAAIASVFGNVRGLTGALNILNQDAEATQTIFDNVAASAGMTDQAFEAVADTAGFKTKQALAQLEAAAIAIGDALLPLVGALATGVGALATAFSGLPQPIQTGIVALAGMAAMAGPVLTVYAKLTVAGKAVEAMLMKTAAAAGVSSAAMARLGTVIATAMPILAAATAAFIAFKVAQDQWAESGREGAAVIEQQILGQEAATITMQDLERQYEAVAAVTNEAVAASRTQTDFFSSDALAATNAYIEGNMGVIETMQRLHDQTEAVSAATGENADTVLQFLFAQQQAGVVFATSEEALSAYQQVMASAAGTTPEAIDAAGALAAEFAEQEARINASKEALAAWENQITALFDPIFGLVDSQNALAEAEKAVNDRTWEVIAASAEYGENSFEAAAAAQALEQAQWDLLAANVDLDSAINTLTTSVETGESSWHEATAAVNQWEASGRVTADQAATMRTRLDEAAASADALSNTPVQLNADGAVASAKELKRELQAAQAAAHIQMTVTRAFNDLVTPFADGGIVTSPTNALIGEAGPEMVLPLTDPARMAELLAHGLGGGFSAGGPGPAPDVGGGGQGGNTVVQLVVDGDVLAETLLRREDSLI